MFLARMNLQGFHEAGKTSFSKRLMGKKFDATVKSTDGIALHYVKSTFNKDELIGKHWKEANITANDLDEEFIEQIKLSVNAPTKLNDGIRRREKQDDDGCRDHKMVPNRLKKERQKKNVQVERNSKQVKHPVH